MIAGALFAVLLVSLQAAMRPTPRAITQRDIDAAVLHTLEHAQLPAAEAKAYEAVRRSVVRVRGYGHDKSRAIVDADKAAKPADADKDAPVVQGVGSGVVIVDTGIILTNMHVVAGAERITVEFEYVLKCGRTGEVLWTERRSMVYAPQSTNTGNPLATLIAAAVSAAMTKAAPNYMPLARQANETALAYPGPGFPVGPYRPEYRSDL